MARPRGYYLRVPANEPSRKPRFRLVLPIRVGIFVGRQPDESRFA